MAHQHVVSEYMEHGACFLWEPGLVWLHVISDIVTGIAYYSIPAALFYFAYKRRDLPFHRVILLFGIFILSCGTTHFLAAYTVFVAEYWVEGGVKAFTALISAVAAFYMIPLIPQAIAMPSLTKSLKENQELNAQLEKKLDELNAKTLEIEKSEERNRDLARELTSLINNVPGIVYRGHRDWSLSFIGAEVELVTGYPPDTFTSGAVGWKEIIHPDDLEQVKEAFRKAEKEKTDTLRVEYRIRNKDGDIRWLADRRQLTYDAEGNFAHVDGLLLDITDRKRAEEEVRESSDRLRAIFQASPLPIVCIELDGTVKLWNRAAEVVFGWTEDEVVGRLLPFVPEDKMGEFHALLAQGQKGILNGVEVRRRRKDGSPVDISIWTSPLSDQKGNAAGIMAVIADITERKRAEEEIHKHEEYLRVALAASDMAVFNQDLDLRYSWMYQPQLGYTTEQVIGKRDAELLPPDLAQQATDLKRRVLETGVGTRGEIESTLDDKRICYDLVVEPLRNTAGQIVGITGASLDITERKLAEEVVKESEEKFRVIFDGSKDGIILADVESRKFHTANNTFCDMLQYTLDEIRQLGVVDIHPEECLSRVYDALEKTMKQGSELSDNIPVRRKDGSIFWAEIKSSPVSISGKNFMLGNFRDVTERRKAEETLARLGMAVDQASEGIVITDREGTILYVNPAFERISGYSREDAIGKNPRILRSGKQDKSLYREIWSTLARGEVWTGHLINRRKDGSLYEEDATISPVRDSSGNTVSFVAVMRDITQLLSLEKQVRMAQKMEAVGTLAGGIAHDFNNALTGIFGFGDLLRERLAGNEQALHDLDEIQRCAERAATLTRQLLTFARRQVIEPVHLNLSALVADLMELIGKVVGEHIEVKTSLGKDVPTIHADRGQIEQVVMNLCLNARDAMPEGGRLVVETGNVFLEEEDVRRNPYMKTGRYALLTVSDTGVGMDEKIRSRVFEPFFTTKGPDKGTGLGLAMVYGIVKQHGGFINLYSEPGKGTAFKVYFPAIEAQPDAVPAIRREESVRGGTETILLAEDEEAIRELAERILTGFGYTVLVARNGEDAIGIFRQHKEIVLAVLDVVMPRKGGKEAFEEMHKQNPGLKVIFMSGYSADGIHDSFVLTPGTPFLQKPFGPTILARKVREVLDTQ